ncbi:MAG: DUF58 domain-containing protein [Kiritimatiellia bacterium]
MDIDTAQLMKKVGRIRILTQRLLDEHLAGDYHSVFKGQGMEFDEVRPYQPGDDVRMIDWNVTARTGLPYIKRFSEERELTVIFMIDVSGSQSFGTCGRSKAALSAELAALLSMAAIRNQDKIGLVLFSDHIVKSIPPRKGRTAVMRLVREVLAAEETFEGTNLREAIRFVSATQKRRAVVFLISDFQDSGYERDLAVFAKRHDVIACTVSDPAEATLPNVGLAELYDPETHQTLLVDTSSRAVREQFTTEAHAREETLLKSFRRAGIDTVPLSTDIPYIDAVRGLFRHRAYRRR